ncbi:MAG: 30S ribosomal protein S1, partial [Clostridia bacterium]|nr:30S ribosomal protein S1 [Clostridia bacterium]
MTNGYLPEGMKLSTDENQEYLASLAGLERAMNEEAILEGIVTLCDADLCLHVDLAGMEGIIEPDEAVFCRAGETRKDIAIISRVGKPVCFTVLSITVEGGKVVAKLSRRRAQERCIGYYMEHLRAGDLLEARVTHLESFGAFLDIGCGVSSLLSVDCISVSRISHPRDRLSPGMSLWVAVRSVDRESGRIYATLRELLGTWEENAAAFKVGQTVTGIIRSVESYGIFVELAPNLAGLAELREGTAEELRLHIGHSAAVYIKSIVPDRMKIKLILIDVNCAEPPRKKLPYFLSPATTPHLSHWIYSPSTAHRLV